jgi:protein O-GlcNAc transferase
VQVAWLAYPGTSGLSAMDYRLTDPYLDPIGMNHAFYSEESIRLPDAFWCFAPLTDGPAVNALPTAKGVPLTFGCFNNFCKVNDETLSLWAGVLQAVPGSRLLIQVGEGSMRDRVHKCLETQGIANNRIGFANRLPLIKYLELYQGIDITLDSFPYNGHTTSLESLWMGVPVVSLCGKTAVSRAGLCQLSNVGLSDLVAYTPQEYVRIAANLARDVPRLSQLRAALRQRMEQSPLMDMPRFARNIEAAYRTMWRRYASNQPPLAAIASLPPRAP